MYAARFPAVGGATAQHLVLCECKSGPEQRAANFSDAETKYSVRRADRRNRPRYFALEFVFLCNKVIELGKDCGIRNERGTAMMLGLVSMLRSISSTSGSGRPGSRRIRRHDRCSACGAEFVIVAEWSAAVFAKHVVSVYGLSNNTIRHLYYQISKREDSGVSDNRHNAFNGDSVCVKKKVAFLR
jgi:hypothetical protein